MNPLVTPSFLFRWSLPVQELNSLPNSSGRLLDLPESSRLPSLRELDSLSDFADVRLAWNQQGFGISVDVRGKTKGLKCSMEAPTSSDGITIWVDTRHTPGMHRATRFCHQFQLMPSGGGRRNAEPVVIEIPLARAREQVAPRDLSRIRLQSEFKRDGYWLDAWIPADVFVGYDPANSSRLGFHYQVQDSERGIQTLAVGTEFPVASDLSLWQTLELVSSNGSSR
jgi:hypothetical protein